MFNALFYLKYEVRGIETNWKWEASYSGLNIALAIASAMANEFMLD